MIWKKKDKFHPLLCSVLYQYMNRQKPTYKSMKDDLWKSYDLFRFEMFMGGREIGQPSNLPLRYSIKPLVI